MREIDFDFIPPHHNCKNCGECCGPLAISEKEYDEIFEYCINNNVRINNHQVSLKNLTCPFRDNEAAKCLIYPARPILCKIFGIVEGMQCKHDNSYNYNGMKFLNFKVNRTLDLFVKLVKNVYERD